MTDVWFSITVKEDEIKWFAVMYNGKRKTLYIAKLNTRFLKDEDGKINKLFKMTCLKPKVGFGTLLENSSKYLHPDQGMFDPWNIIYDLVTAIPCGSNKFDVPEYYKAHQVFLNIRSSRMN